VKWTFKKHLKLKPSISFEISFHNHSVLAQQAWFGKGFQGPDLAKLHAGGECIWGPSPFEGIIDCPAHHQMFACAGTAPWTTTCVPAASNVCTFLLPHSISSSSRIQKLKRQGWTFFARIWIWCHSVDSVVSATHVAPVMVELIYIICMESKHATKSYRFRALGLLLAGRLRLLSSLWILLWLRRLAETLESYCAKSTWRRHWSLAHMVSSILNSWNTLSYIIQYIEIVCEDHKWFQSISILKFRS